MTGVRYEHAGHHRRLPLSRVGIEPLPRDLFEVVVGALADALVADYQQDLAATVTSRRGMNRRVSQADPAQGRGPNQGRDRVPFVSGSSRVR